MVVIHISLQAVRQELVHLGDASGDGEINGAVADFDDKSAHDIGVDLEHVLECLCLGFDEQMLRVSYLIGDLELLASTDVRGLGDGSLQP